MPTSDPRSTRGETDAPGPATTADADRARQDARLDEELEETFPASDATSPATAMGPVR